MKKSPRDLYEGPGAKGVKSGLVAGLRGTHSAMELVAIGVLGLVAFWIYRVDGARVSSVRILEHQMEEKLKLHVWKIDQLESRIDELEEQLEKIAP